MKRDITLIVLMIISSINLFSQSTVYQDDFESYTAGQGLASQSNDWETWSNPSGGGADDALISTTHANSGTKSLNIINGKDMVYKFGSMSSGHYKVDFNFFIESNYGLYLNLEHAFGTNWAFDLWVTETNKLMFYNGTDSLQIGSCSNSTWHNLMFDINLTSDSIIILLDNNPLDTFSFSRSKSGIPSNTLDCINFYGLSSGIINNSKYWVDDFEFTNLEQQNIVTIGTGTITNTTTSYPAPYGNYWWGARHQMLIPASEIISAGGYAGNINSLAFDVQTPKGISLQNFTIKIGTTAISAITSWQTGLNTVYSSSYTDVIGWNTHVFTNSFLWNGTDNLVIEVCFNNSSYTNNAIVNQSSTSYSSCIYYRADATGVCSNSIIAGTFYQRPNIRLEFQAPIDLDAGISAINSPAPPFIPGMQNIAATLKNLGSTTTLTSASIGWSVNGITQSPYSWTGSLSPSATADSISLGSYYFPYGNNTVKVWSYLPNGTTDSLPNNDTITSTNNFTFNNSPPPSNNCGDFPLQFLYDSLNLISSAGCETDGNYFYVTRWNDTTIWKLNMNGNLVDSFGIVGVSNLWNLTYDGTYFYGCNSGNTIYKMNFNSNPPSLISTITCSAVTVGNISFDSTANNSNGGFWVGSWSTNLYLVSRTGLVLDSVLASNHGQTAMSDIAFDNISSGGPYIWTINGDGNPVTLTQIKVSTGLPTGIAHNCENEVSVSGEYGGGLWIHPNLITGTTTIGGLIQGNSIFGYKIAPEDSFDLEMFNVNSNFINNSLQISAAVNTLGISQPNSFTMNYSVNNDTVYSEVVANPTFINNQYVMTFAQAWTIQNLGNNNVKIWISNVNGNNADITNCNDTMSTTYYHTTPVNPIANKFYVDSASSCVFNCGGTSWATATNNLQHVLSVANAGDTIFIAKGTYYPDEADSLTNNDVNAYFLIPDSVVVLGGYPTGGGNRDWVNNKTILSGEIQQDNDSTNNSYYVVKIIDATSQTSINGITIKRANGNGMSIYNNYNNLTNPEIINCCFIHNGTSSNGGAIRNYANYSTSVNPTIINCKFINNYGNWGAAIFNFGVNSGVCNPTITNCIFTNNNTGSYGSGGAIKNYGGVDNSWQTAGISNPLITNCTFSNNTAYYGGALSNGISTGGTCSPIIKNCIFWNNNAQNGSEIYNSSADPLFSYCIIDGCGDSGSQWDTLIGTDGGNNIDFDPLFIDAINNNVRLHTCSKAIDAGFNNNIPSGVTTDLDNNPRIYNSGTVDLGAFEAQSSAGHITLDSVSVLQSVSCSTFGKAQLYYSSTGTLNSVLWDNGENTNIADSLTSPIHKVYVSNTVSACMDSAIVNLPFNYLLGKIYVDSIANGNNNGCSWSNAFNNLQDALRVTSPGDTVFVAKGTYFPDKGFGIVNNNRDISFILTDSVKLIGGYPNGGGTRNWQTNKTILSGEIQQDTSQTNNSHQIMRTEFVTTETTIDGFVFTNAYSTTALGGGLYNKGADTNLHSNPVIKNCKFVNNVALYGGGIYNDGRNLGESSPVILNCVFDGNETYGGGYGGAIRNNGHSDPLIENCVFKNNKALNNGGGGAIANSGNGAACNPVINNCRFEDNQSQWAGAIYNTASGTTSICNPQITNCLFINNIAQSGGGVFYNQAYDNGNCNPKITNCTFTKNTAGWGALMMNDGDQLHGDSLCQPVLTNCIVWGNINTNSAYSRIYNGYVSVPPFIKNSILMESGGSGNQWDSIMGIDAGNNLDVNPLFIDSINFRLQACSQAIDAGINDSIPSSITLDLDSNLRRYNNGIVDLGAYEYQGTASYVRIDSVNVLQNATCSTFGQGQVYFSPASNSNSISWSNGETTHIADSLINSYNTVYVINTNGGCNDSAVIYIPTNISGNLIYVDSSATNGTNSGCSWSNAFTNLQDALLNAKAGDSVLVAQGTYYPDETMSTNTDEPNISFVIPDSVIVLGGYPTSGGIRDWNTYHTILSGEIQQDAIDSNNTNHVVFTRNVTSVTHVDGFIISQGYGDWGGAWLNDGSGVNNSSSPIINNCNFYNNTGTVGAGGIYNKGLTGGNSSPFISNCIFENNEALEWGGGAVYNDGDQNGNSNSIIVNCVFINNIAPKGGAVFNDGKNGGYSAVEIINCSFTKNSASTNGGAIYNDALDNTGYCNSTVSNCILWNNSIGNNTEIYNDGIGKSTISYSIIKGSSGSGVSWNTQLGIDGGNNLDASPLFADTLTNDLHLITCPIGSPAINNGINDSIPSGVTTDLEGNVRIFNSTVDMGAYEALSIPGTVMSYLSQNICQGDSFLFDNNYLTITGTYYDTLFNASSAGCDSVIQLALTVLPSYSFIESDTICNGDSILWHGAYYLTNGIYYDSLITTSSCDSIFMLELFVNPTFAISEFDTICAGDTLTWHGLNYSSSGIYYDSLTTINGCDSTIQLNLYIKPGPIATITALGPTTFCDGGNVILQAYSGSYAYDWLQNGLSIANYQSSLTVTQGGNYSVIVTDTTNSLNCSTTSNIVSVTVNSSNFNISYAGNPTTIASPPYFTVFYNQTPNSSNYSWNWLFGDGNSSTQMAPTHTYTSSGIYSVSAIATDATTGCSDTLLKPGYITCTSSNPCPVVAEIYPSSPVTICANDSLLLHSVSHNSTYTYQWLYNGVQINGATDSIFWAKNAGTYKLMVSDTCTNYSTDFILYKYPANIPVIQANGSIQPCTNDSMELYVSGSYNSYLWSTGQNTSSIYVKTSGQYVVSVIDANSCSFTSSAYLVNTSLLQIPEICIVGVDSATNNNRIIWQREANPLIDSFRVYRETTVSNQYQLIGSKAFNNQSLFIDANSNPAQQAYRYKIAAVDTCGAETPMSDFHKTNHLTINAGLNNTWNLIWDGYQGFNFGSYRIYRGTDSLNLQFLTQIQSNLTSLTDLNPPTGNVYYQVEVVSPHNCYPDSVISKANTNYNTSRTNVASTASAPNIGFEIIKSDKLICEVYPNPNKGSFNIGFKSKSEEEVEIKIYSSLGKLIYTDNTNITANNTKQIDLGEVAKGVYYLKLTTKSNKTFYSKIIVN